MMMDGRAGEQRRNGNAIGACLAIRQDDDVAAVANFLLGPLAQFVERPPHAVCAMLGRKSDVEDAGLEMIAPDLGNRTNLLEILVGENWLTHLKALRF
jgi:hypothetical protein